MALDGWAAANILAKWALYAAVLLAVGSALFAMLFNRRAVSLWPRLRRGVLIGSALAASATGLQLMLQAGLLSGSGLMGMADTEMLALLWATPAGDAALLRWIGLGVLTLATMAPRPGFVIGASLAALAICASFTLSGHTTNGPGVGLQLLVSAHVLAGAFWAGALWPLRAAALGASPLAEAAALADRFGRVAVWVVAGLISAGAVSAYLLVGSLEALLTSAYGLTLLAKAALVGMVMLLAALNKLRLTPGMLAGRADAAAGLAWSIRLEAALFAMVLLATATLTSGMIPPE